MQVLVTGAAGKLGRILRKVWLQTGALGRGPVWTVRQPVFPDDVTWDILSGPVPPIAKSAVIFHLAGILRGDAASLAANTALALMVCKTAKKAGAKHVFLASSAAVYGSSCERHTEETLPWPQSDYGHAKLNMEREALNWAQNAGANAPGVTCLRIGNVLGADMLLGKAVHDQEILLDPVPGHRKGPIRSYIGPHAFAQVIAKLISSAVAGASLPEILNIAAPKPVYMADLLLAAKQPFRFGPPNSGIIPSVNISSERLASLVPLVSTPAKAMVADWQRLLAYPT